MDPGFPRTLPQVFDRVLTKYAGRVALRQGGESLSYRALDERSARVAGVLAELD